MSRKLLTCFLFFFFINQPAWLQCPTSNDFSNSIADWPSGSQVLDLITIVNGLPSWWLEVNGEVITIQADPEETILGSMLLDDIFTFSVFHRGNPCVTTSISGSVNTGTLQQVNEIVIDSFTREVVFSYEPDPSHTGAAIMSFSLMGANQRGTLLEEASLSLDVIEAEGSAGSLVLLEGTETGFNAVGTDVRIGVLDISLPASPEVRVFRNNVLITAGNIQVTGDEILLPQVLGSGPNRFEVFAGDIDGRSLSGSWILWAGTSQLNVSVQDENGQAVANAMVTVKLEDNQEVQMMGISDANGQAQFQNVPPFTIETVALAPDGSFGSRITTGNQGAIVVQVTGIGPPSAIDNNDFSLGSDGWDIGNAPVDIIPHSEDPPAFLEELFPEEEFSADRQAMNEAIRQRNRTWLEEQSYEGPDNFNLRLGTLNEGPQTITRTFQTDPDTESVSVRYRFITSEVPGGFFGSQYNDSFNVNIRSQSGGGLIVDSNSMNGLGLGAFTAGGYTFWRENTLVVEGTQTLKVNGQGDTVKVTLSVTNVGDGAYDSWLEVDLVAQKSLAITNLALTDIDDTQLNFLSVAPHGYFQGDTRVRGSITLIGNPQDTLQKLELEVIRDGQAIATGTLDTSTGRDLLTPFGQDGRITGSLLFNIDSAQFTEDYANGTVALKVKAQSGSGETAEKPFNHPLEILVRYTEDNRYGQRDPGRGGDDWVKPSVKSLLEIYGSNYGSLEIGDISNMNAGIFPPHGLHHTGNDVDGWYEGYFPRDANTAAIMIQMLNEPEGSDISLVYVTFAAQNGDPFWDAIKDVTLDDGRLARNVIVPLENHATHFHWRIPD